MIGDWMLTYSGRRFYPLDPVPDDIHILDVAHSLSNLCRFTGHCSQFYSVAQHSVLVSLNVPKGLEMWGLLHDAHEAYIGDIGRPLKRSLMAYPETRALLTWTVKLLDWAIAKRFGLPEITEQMSDHLHKADNLLLATEARDMMD